MASLGWEDKGKTFHTLHALVMHGDLWDRFCGVGSETLKGCEWVELLVVLTRLRGTGKVFLIPMK